MLTVGSVVARRAGACSFSFSCLVPLTLCATAATENGRGRVGLHGHSLSSADRLGTMSTLYNKIVWFHTCALSALQDTLRQRSTNPQAHSAHKHAHARTLYT